MAEKQVKDYDKFNLRFPDGMRDAIAERARANGRSMNSEIVHILADVLARELDLIGTDESLQEERERLLSEREKVNTDFWNDPNITQNIHLDERLKRLEEIANRLEKIMIHDIEASYKKK